MKHDFVLTNSDTDSISFRKPDGSPFSEKEQESLIAEINTLMPKMIEYEHDGYYDAVLVIKAKNYVLKTGDKIKYKGSSILDAKKEKALMELMHDVINDLIDNDGVNYIDIYHKYIIEACNIQDIDRWSTKKSITKKVLDPTRTNEQKILDAVDDDIREGDKVYLYTALDGLKQKIVKGELVFKKSGEPHMVENLVLKQTKDWIKDEHKMHYIKRVHMTMNIFKEVLDIPKLKKYHNVGEKKNLDILLGDDL